MAGVHELAIVFAFAWFALGWYPCRACFTAGAECDKCAGTGLTPARWNLDLAGVVDDNCATCETFNDTLFVLDQVSTLGACADSAAHRCRWIIYDTACNGHYTNTTTFLVLDLTDTGVRQLVQGRGTIGSTLCYPLISGGVTEAELDAAIRSGSTIDCKAQHSGGMANTVSALHCDFDVATYELEYK
jgi:hypothetical protein